MHVREAHYEVFHRPDRSTSLRAMLDLWGFDSYVNYLYTVCELGFLEGVIPVVDFGFLTPDEMKHLSEVASIIKCPLFTEYDHIMDIDKIRTIDRSSDIRKNV